MYLFGERKDFKEKPTMNISDYTLQDICDDEFIALRNYQDWMTRKGAPLSIEDLYAIQNAPTDSYDQELEELFFH